MKKVASFRCTFCHMAKETITHLFLECNVITNFWFQIRQKYICLKDLRMSEKTIIFGVIEEGTSCVKLVAYIKYFIWKCRLNETVPKIVHLRNFLSYHKDYDEVFMNVLNENQQAIDN